MISLTNFLQNAFSEHCPRGWVCEAEVPLVDRKAAQRLGFDPRADVRLTKTDCNRRIWVEFEVSRADPVANHAKFASVALLEGMAPGDCFVSMTSRHIAPGRAALAAGTAIWMRSLGIPAFQIPLLPQFNPQQIKRLNSRDLSYKDINSELSVIPEINRILDVSSAAHLESGHRIHRADNNFSVALNVRQWNSEIRSESGRSLWGRRRVQYFVMDHASQEFAPCKFCAFIPGPAMLNSGSVLGMTMAIYAQLGEGDPRFDGNVARRHLEGRLDYKSLKLESASVSTRQAFLKWFDRVEGALIPHSELWVLEQPAIVC